MNQQPPNQYQYDSYNPQQNFGQQYPYPPAPPKTSTKSIVALIFGILSILIPYIGFIPGIVAIIVASLSFKDFKQKGEQGRGLSIAGLVCGIIGTVIWGLVTLLVVIGLLMYVNGGDNFYNNYYTNF
ncbi:DUF4190 domain-containing protein [Paenibacillus antibioticophila]|uniref:DUF4190 domain-containing protein n=1 Tax=Paenibacillus antibioticophila TaxID=1274374 RepID=UPI0005CA126F|nr:DUF4190 domain-containing protein [Paenibacillus antibioticophila]